MNEKCLRKCYVGAMLHAQCFNARQLLHELMNFISFERVTRLVSERTQTELSQKFSTQLKLIVNVSHVNVPKLLPEIPRGLIFMHDLIEV